MASDLLVAKLERYFRDSMTLNGEPSDGREVEDAA
jgi:hypothetical protein